MNGMVALDGIEYVPVSSEEEFGWCWCTDDRHGPDMHRLGCGPIWCGSRYYADSYRTAVLTPADRKGMHRVKRRYLLLHAPITKES